MNQKSGIAQLDQKNGMDQKDGRVRTIMNIRMVHSQTFMIQSNHCIRLRVHLQIIMPYLMSLLNALLKSGWINPHHMKFADRYCRIVDAAKKMRIKTHPDRLKKEGMSDEEKAKIDEAAAKVGQAADILSDPAQVSLRLKY